MLTIILNKKYWMWHLLGPDRTIPSQPNFCCRAGMLKCVHFCKRFQRLHIRTHTAGIVSELFRCTGMCWLLPLFSTSSSPSPPVVFHTETAAVDWGWGRDECNHIRGSSPVWGWWQVAPQEPVLTGNQLRRDWKLATPAYRLPAPAPALLLLI